MRVRSFTDLAVSAARSAERLDRLERLGATRPVPPEFVAHERSLCERRCLALLDAVRNADNVAFRWDLDGRM